MATAPKTKSDAPARLAGSVLAGRGLPGLARAAAEVLGAPVAFLDRSGIVLAAAGATQAQETKLAGGGKGVKAIELKLGDATVGEARYIGTKVDAGILELIAAFSALEI